MLTAKCDNRRLSQVHCNRPMETHDSDVQGFGTEDVFPLDPRFSRFPLARFYLPQSTTSTVILSVPPAVLAALTRAWHAASASALTCSICRICLSVNPNILRAESV